MTELLSPRHLEEVAEAVAADRLTPRAATSLQRRHAPLASAAEQLRILDAVRLEKDGVRADFDKLLPGGTLRAGKLDIFQVNLGKLCNMACKHCHVDAGPDRTDAMMSDEVAEQVIAAMKKTAASTVDLTGGAPELHPRFRDMVEAAVQSGKHVMDRCNLTILLVPRNAGLIEWLGERKVEVVASLPHYRRPNTDSQRGDGVFEKSIKAMRLLNEAGYGQGDPERRLTLVSNPSGAFLGASQATLEKEWRQSLQREHGITFDRLFVLNNMPISRFLEWLETSGNLEGYMQKLLAAFNPGAVDGLMCRNTLSIGWDGRLYDCDFNQMLDLEIDLPGGPHIRDFDEAAWTQRKIVTARHCLGCTAGAGSSCGGQTA